MPRTTVPPPATPGLFVTGTDTDVGKTAVAVAIARRLHALRSFWRYLLDTEAVAHDPWRKVALTSRVASSPRSRSISSSGR